MKAFNALVLLFLLSACFSGGGSGDQSTADIKKIDVSFDSISLSEGESKFIDLNLSTKTTENMNLKWTIEGEYAASRFVFTSGTVAVTKDTLSLPVQIQSQEDTDYNPNITYTITLESLSSTRQKLNLMTQSFMLVDNDPKPQLSFASAANAVIESAGTIPVYVNLTQALGKDATVLYKVSGTSTTDNSDVTLTGSFTYPKGVTSSFFNIDIIDDADVEGVENLILELDKITYDDIDLLLDMANYTHNLTINDNESVTISDPTVLSISDATANSGYARGLNVSVAITEDVVTTKWCLSELQSTKPANGSAICVGGAGPSNGWYTTEPTSFVLSGGDATKTVYIWTANAFDNVNANAVSSSIVLDTVAPTVTVGQGGSQADPATSLNIVFDAVFSEQMLAGSLLASEVQITGSAFGPGVLVNTADNTNFTLEVNSINGNGTLSGAIPASVATDLAGNPNAASTPLADNTITTNFTEGNIRYRSIGPGNTTALKSRADDGGIVLSIMDSRASFSKDLPSNVGVGDILLIDRDLNTTLDSYAFITKRLGPRLFELQSSAGGLEAFLSSSSNANWSIYRAYTSLADAENGTINAGVSVAFDAWTGGRDIVANNESWTFYLYADGADAGQVTFNAWTTSGFNTITVDVPKEINQVGVSQAHSGVWDNTKARIVSAGFGIRAEDHFISFKNLQVQADLTNTQTSAIRFVPRDTNVTLYRVENNIIKTTNASTADDRAAIYAEFSDASNHSGRLFNNLILPAGTIGVKGVVGTLDVLNNTIAGGVSGIEIGTLQVPVIRNNIIQDMTGDSFLGASPVHADSSNNLTDDAVSRGTSAVTNTSLTFINKAGEDYRLALGDVAAIGAAVDLSSGFNYSFASDILGASRLTWDIGAFAANLTPHTWTGAAADGNWSNTANWEGGAVPTNTDIAHFNYLCTVNCNANMNQNVDVAGLLLGHGYSGTLTQLSTRSLDIGNSAFVQYSGNFVGGDTDININFTGTNSGNALSIFGGSFTSTSAKVFTQFADESSSGDALVLAYDANFIHNSGTFEVQGQNACVSGTTHRISSYQTVDFYNLNFLGTHSCTDKTSVLEIAGGEQIKVSNDLSFMGGGLSGGSIELHRHLTMNAGGTYTEKPTITNTVIELKGTANQNITGAADKLGPKLVIDKPSGQVLPASLDFMASSLSIVNGEFVAPTGILVIKKDILDGGNFFSRTGGLFTHNNGKVHISSYSTAVSSLSRGLALDLDTDFNELDLDPGVSTGATPHAINITGTGNLNVLSTLDFSSGNVTGNSIYAKGNINFVNLDSGATSNLNIDGTTDQSLNVAGGETINGNITVNKATGNLSLLSAVSFNAAGQDLDLQAGSMLLSGALTINDNLNLAAGTVVHTYCNPVTYTTLTGTGTLNGGAGTPSVSVNDVTADESNNLVFTVTADNYSCTGDIDVNYYSYGITAKYQDGDYSAASGTVTISQGDISGTITVSVIDDTFWEEDETFEMRLNGITGATISDGTGIGTIQDNDLGGAGHIWTGAAADGSWNNTANWSGAAIPGSGDVAYFEATNCGVNCNANIDTTVNVRGIRAHSNYTGTITQNTGQAITIGNGGLLLNSTSTFVGADSDIITDGYIEILGNFTSTTGILRLQEHHHLLEGGTYTFPVGSTLHIKNLSSDGGTGSIRSKIDGLTVHNLTIENNLDHQMDDSTVTVNGNLNFNSKSSSGQTVDGHFNVHGDVNAMSAQCGGGQTDTYFNMVGVGAQTINGLDGCSLPTIMVNKPSGTLSLVGIIQVNDDFLHTSGTVDPGTSTVRFKGSLNRTDISVAGMSFYNLENEKNGNSFVLLTDVPVTNNLILDSNVDLDGTFSFLLSGDLTVDTASGGDAAIRFMGSGTQNYTRTTGTLPKLIFAHTGTINNSNVFTITDTGLEYISGSFTSTPDFQFNPQYTHMTIDFNSLVVNNLNFYTTSSSRNLTFTSDVTVNGNMIINGTGSSQVNALGTGKINLKGDYTANFPMKGPVVIEVNGTAPQTIGGGSGTQDVLPAITINSSSTVTFSNVFANGKTYGLSSDFTYVAGTIDLTQASFTADWSNDDSVIDFGGNDVYRLGFSKDAGRDVTMVGTTRVNILIFSTAQSATSLSGGTIEVLDELTHLTSGGGSTQIKFVGSGDATINKDNTYTLPGNMITVDKSGGELVLDGNVNLNQSGADFFIVNGDVRMNGNNLQIHDNLDIAATGTLFEDCGTLTYGTKTGAGSVNTGGGTPNLSISDLSIEEGEVGKVELSLDIVDCSNPVSVDISIAEITATFTDNDFTSDVSTGQTITFASGERKKEITITSIEDTIVESDETFNINLSNASGLTIADAQSVVTITNDDTSNSIWVGGGGDSNWSTAANWQSGTVPNSTEVAYFDSSCGGNCNVTIDTAVNVLGIRSDATYTGTITQGAGVAMTIGDADFILEAGNFVGSNASITVTGHVKVGTGTFNSTSGVLTIGKDNGTAASLKGFEKGSGTFTHNNGSVRFVGVSNQNCSDAPANRIILAGPVSFYDLNVSISDQTDTGCDTTANKFNDTYLDLVGGYSVTVNNDLTVEDGYLNGGSYIIQGDAYFTCDDGNHFTSQKCAGGGNSTLRFQGAGAKNINFVSGARAPIIYVNSGSSVTSTGAASNVGAHSVIVNFGLFNAPTTDFELYGTNGQIQVLGASSYQAGTKTSINTSKAIGCSDETIFTIDPASSISFTDLDITVNDTSIDCIGSRNQAVLEIAAGDNLIVNGNLHLIDGIINQGVINLLGNLEMHCDSTNGPVVDDKCSGAGSTTVNLLGTAMQSITQDSSALYPFAGTNFNNANGFILNTLVNMNNTDIDVTNGDINMNNFDFIGIGDISTYTGTITKQGVETLTYTNCLGGPVGAPCP